jgi:hypothetical protein
MTASRKIQQDIMQISTIVAAWALLYAVWSYPELQIAGPVLLWIFSSLGNKSTRFVN